VYSVPQNLNYNFNGVQRQRTNGQLTLQYAPVDTLTTTLDYTYSENKIQTKRNDLSAWFNFGPSTSSWTKGPVASPLVYTEFRSRRQQRHRDGRGRLRHQDAEQIAGLQRRVETEQRPAL
jgi:hypothetical protein